MKLVKIHLYLIVAALVLVWACDRPLEITGEDGATNLELVEMAKPGDTGGNDGAGNGNGKGNGNGNGNNDGIGNDKGNGGGNGSGNGKGSGGGKKGDLFGDLYELYRDANGVPILSENGCVQPVDVYGVPLPLDEECHPFDETAVIEVALGRLNNVRSPEKTLLRGLDEVLGFLVQADTIKTDASGRMVINIDGVDKTTDAPIENLAIYREMLNNGSISVNLKGTVVIEDGLEVMFDGDTEPDASDLFVARGFLAGATDKSIALSIDKIMYSHVIMELDGTIVQNGLEYIDFIGLNFTYDRETAYAETYVDVLVEVAPGSYERQTVNIFEAVFDGQTYSETGGIAVYTMAADDARRVIEYIHEYEIPL